MDAAHKLLKNLAILLALSLLMAAPGWAQTLQAPATVTIGSSGFNTASVTSSTGSPNGSTEITYTIGAPNYSGDTSGSTNTNWLAVSGGTTTPATLTFSLRTTAGLNTNASATVTLTPTTGAAVIIKVIFTGTGNGGGGGSNILTASANPVNLAAGINSSTSGTVNVTTSSSTAITITVSSAIVTGGTNWLGIQSVSTNTISSSGGTTITLSANSVSLTSGLTYQGTVTVTPNTGTPLVINVNFTVGGTGGNGSWTVSPSSVTWGYTSGGTFSTQFISVSTTSGQSSYIVNLSSTGNGWLLGSASGGGTGTSFSVPVTAGGFTLQLSSVVASLSQGTYTGQAIISDSTGNQQAAVSVNLSVNGGNSFGLSFSPNPVSFTAPLNGSQQSQSVSVLSSTGGNFSISSTLPSWLTVVPPTNSFVTANQSTAFTVFANPFGLAANTYTGAIQIVVGSQTGTVNVSMAVGGGGGGGTGTTAVAPTTLSFAYQFGTNPAFVAQQKLVITGPAGAWSSSIFTVDGGSWLKLTPSGGTNLPNPASSSDTPIVSINPTGLNVGSYSGTITITTPGGNQQVSVSLNVVSSTILLPTPGALIFTAQTGQAQPPVQSVFFSNSDSGLNVNTTPISAVANSTWITATVPSGATYVSVSVNQSSLSTGTYSGSVSVSQSGAANSPTAIPVLLVVNGGGSGGSTGSLSFNPSSMSFSSLNGSTPGAQTLSVNANSSTSFVGTVTYTSGSGSWLTVTPLSGVTPTNLTVSTNPAGLAAGTYGATISFNANGLIQTVPVSLTVSTNGGGNTGNITVTPTSLTFTAPQGSSPGAQSISVASASGTAGVGFTVQVTAGSNWLATSANVNNSTPTTLTVSVNSTILQPATYNGNIQILPTGGNAVNIPVTLTVTAPASISATPTTLTFNYRAGDSAPASQPIAVAGSGLAFTATASSTGNWLLASPASGTAPATVNVSINTTGLSTGTYTGTVLVAGTNGASGSTTVTVTLNVTAPLPTVTKVTNAASYAAAGVSPGEIITLFASDPAHPIGPATPVGLTLDSSGNVSTSIGGVQVTVGGFACPMIYASATQVSAVVPYEIKQFLSANIVLKFLGQSSNGVAVSVVTTSPGLFTANSSGTGPGAIANSDGSTNSPSNPAARGGIVVVYLTGEGATNPAGVTGKVTTVAAPPAPLTPVPLLPISITIGGQGANYTFAGEAPNFVSGVLQLNVVVPTNITAGDQPIVVTIGANPSQQAVTVSVK